MTPFLRAAALALAATASLTAGAAAAADLQVVSGSGQRALTLPPFGPAGQSFTALDTNLTSFGFQFNALNPTSPNLPFTFSLFAGETLTGTAITTRTFTLPESINSRTPVWFDFDITGTQTVVGQRYTGVLSTDGIRNGVILGPDINIFTGAELTGDAYAGGRAIFTREVYPNCAQTGNCDLNFRVSGFTPVAAVPEPQSWALMIGGFGLVGGTLRRRARTPNRLRAAHPTA